MPKMVKPAAAAALSFKLQSFEDYLFLNLFKFLLLQWKSHIIILWVYFSGMSQDCPTHITQDWKKNHFLQIHTLIQQYMFMIHAVPWQTSKNCL